jgi:hypothetical protein
MDQAAAFVAAIAVILLVLIVIYTVFPRGGSPSSSSDLQTVLPS